MIEHRLISPSYRNIKASSTAPTDPTVISNVQDPAVLAKVSDQEVIIGGTMDYESKWVITKYMYIRYSSS